VNLFRMCPLASPREFSRNSSTIQRRSSLVWFERFA